MHKTISVVALAILAACQIPAGQTPDIGAVVRDTVAIVDKNADGSLSNREVKDAGKNTELWLLVGGLLTSVFAAMRGQSAHNAIKHVGGEVDELWEAQKKA